MESSGASPTSRVRSAGRRSGGRPVSPVLPLLLLETMRDRDRPEEVLEDEDITLSLPRRLGLSEVVRTQIQRFEEEVRQRRPQPASQIEDLIRLVNKRPDAREIFTTAGAKLARRRWEERPGSVRGVITAMPRAVALIAAQRGGKRMLSDLVGPSRFKLTRRPFELRIDEPMTARADLSGTACALYAGMLEELLQLYTQRAYRVLHPYCKARSGDGPCVWSVEIAS